MTHDVTERIIKNRQTELDRRRNENEGEQEERIGISKYGRGQIPPTQRKIQAGREFDSFLFVLNIGDHAQQSLQVVSVQYTTGHHRREGGC
jgi:hypothetical protein